MQWDLILNRIFNGGAKNEEISLSELESSYSIQAGQPQEGTAKAVLFLWLPLTIGEK